MIPDLVQLDGVPWPVLPAGIHEADLKSIKVRFAYNQRRRVLFGGIFQASVNLAVSGCRRLFLDGSFVTDKLEPNDFDACWDPQGVDYQKLDPVFFDFNDRCAAQKAKFFGEFYVSTTMADAQRRTFVEFFQVEKFTRQPKGIVLIDLTTDCMLKQQVTP